MPPRHAGGSGRGRPLFLSRVGSHSRRPGGDALIVFWDLDGPILDVSERYWRLHRDILSELGHSHLDQERYWALKRAKEPEASILDACGARAVLDAYQAQRESRLETRPYLAFDRVQDGARTALEHFGRGHEQVLVTLRGERAHLDWQLEELALRGYFSAVLASGEITEPRWKMKVDLVGEHMKHHAERRARHVLITDTETDVRSGRELGFATVAISNGIRSPSLLQAARPDLLLARTSDLLDPAVLETLEGP